MKIRVNADKYHFTIPFPIRFLLNGITARLVVSCLKGYTDVPLTTEQLILLFREIKKAKRIFGNLTLVDVHTSDGNKVHISL